MSDQPESPRRESPAGDARHPGQEPERSIAPESGDSAPNLPDARHEEKADSPHEKRQHAAKGTDALLNRITGILRQAAEEAPGDPIVEDSTADKDAGEKSFPEKRHAPRRDTSQLRVLVTGAPRTPEEEPVANNENAESRAAEAVQPPSPTAPKKDESATQDPGENDDIDDLVTRLSTLPDVTGQLNAPFTGVLRGTDSLNQLRAEMEVEGQEDQDGSGEAASPEDGLSVLERLLKQQETYDEGVLGTMDGLEALAGLRSEAQSLEEPAGEASTAPQVWDAASDEVTTDEAARLEDRFAMLGVEPDALPDAPVTPPAAEPARSDPKPFAGPHFDDAVMFPDEQIQPPFAATEEAPSTVSETLAAPEISPSGRGPGRLESIYEDLRQTLAEEESARRKRATGGLLRRITGSLRRTTDNLRKGKTGPVGQPEQPLPTGEAEILVTLESTGEDFTGPDFSGFDQEDFAEEPPAEPLTQNEETALPPPDDLLAGLDSTGQAAKTADTEDWIAAIRERRIEDEAAPVTSTPPAEEQVPPAEPAPEEPPRTITGRLARMVAGFQVGQAARKKSTKELDIPDDVVAGRLQRSMETGMLNANKTRELDPAELEAFEAAPPIAQAAPVEEGNLDIEPQNQGITGQLRSFITGILRSAEPPDTTGPLQTGDLPEGAVADQEQLSTQRKTPRRTSERRETFDAQTLRQDMVDPAFSSPSEQFVSEEELLRQLGAEQPASELETEVPEDRFGVIFDQDNFAGANLPQSETGGLEGVVEETTLPTGELPGEQKPEDIWGSGINQPAQEEDALWYVPEEEGDGVEAETYPTNTLFEEISEDALIAAYLGGPTVLQESGTESPASQDLSVPDLRAIALENYGEGEGPEGAESPGSALGEETEGKKGLLAWVASLSVLQKILLGEVVLLVVLVPFLIFATLNAPEAESPAIVFPMPQALPAGVPHPTGITLTGGWHFDLQKSTFVEGKWTPAGSEWLEGTEVRRVIALPWNRQTDAVVQTFQPGDSITLTLSNMDEVEYRITSIERRSATEADFLADRKLSLVIFFYDEDAEDRWVIIGER